MIDRLGRSALTASTLLIGAVWIRHQFQGANGSSVEQRAPGSRPPAALVASFDGLGEGFVGPHGTSTGRNPSDNSIAVHAATFRPKDTMYVSVLTSARGSGTIAVRWKLGSQVLQELTREVSYNDQAATDFRFQAADGFPPATYTIEVLLDGQVANTTTVRVEN